MVKLIATKAHSYGNKFHKRGATYDAAATDARILIGLGRAKQATAAAPVAADDDVTKLATAYEAIAGKKAHHLWKAPRLKEEIAKAEAALTA